MTKTVLFSSSAGDIPADLAFKNNYGADAAPTANDDMTVGYSLGSTWINGADIYTCVNATAGAAVWQQSASATGGVAWDDITGKPAVIAAGADQATARTAIGAGTSNLALGTTASTALAGNTAIPAAASTAPAALAAAAAVGTGTTWARADHVHAIPGASNGTLRGTVLQQAAIPNAAAAPTQAEFNAVLTALRAAGVITP